MIDWEKRAALAVAMIEQLAASLDAADEAAKALRWEDVSASLLEAKKAMNSHLSGGEK